MSGMLRTLVNGRQIKRFITNMVYWLTGKPINTLKRVPIPVLMAKLTKKKSINHSLK